MLESLKQLISYGLKNPICIAVHALLNTQTENLLLRAGAKQIITCNTIIHSTNQVDISNIISNAIIELYGNGILPKSRNLNSNKS